MDKSSQIFKGKMAAQQVPSKDTDSSILGLSNELPSFSANQIRHLHFSQ